jgi:hypothetical protein
MGIMRRHRRQKGILEDCAEGNNKRIRRKLQICGSQRTHLRRIGRAGCTVIKCIRRMRGIQISALKKFIKEAHLETCRTFDWKRTKTLYHLAAYSHVLVPVLRVRDIFGTDPVPLIRTSDERIRFRILLFSSGASRRQQKKIFYISLPLLFEATFASFFEDKKSLRSRKTVIIKDFLTLFAGW